MKTEEKQNTKKWPATYYATKQECALLYLRKATVARARRAGILGWRSSSA